MNKEQVLAIIRHVLTAIGAVLTLKGVIDEVTTMAIIGAVMTAISGIWSIVDKSEASTLKKADEIMLKIASREEAIKKDLK